MDIVTLAASRKYTDKKIAESAAVGIKYEIVDSLPSSGEAQTIYFVKNDSSWINNYYDEYVWISSSGSFEKIGSTQLDDFIQNPSAAEVGQTIVVKEVNEKGKPIAWEMADLPEQIQVDASLTQSGQAADAAVVGQRLGELSEQIGDLSYLTTTEKSNLVLAINESVQNSHNANTSASAAAESASAAAESARVANECAQAMAGTFDFTGYLRYQIVNAAPETYDEGVLYIVTTA